MKNDTIVMIKVHSYLEIFINMFEHPLLLFKTAVVNQPPVFQPLRFQVFGQKGGVEEKRVGLAEQFTYHVILQYVPRPDFYLRLHFLTLPVSLLTPFLLFV